MITSQLLHPASIVVVGASNNVHKPGGAILKNLLSGGYTGELRARYGPCHPCHTCRALSRCGGDACCGEAGEGVHYPFCRFW